MKQDMMMILYILFSLVVIGIFVYLYWKCNKKTSEGFFCGACQGIGNKICTNRSLLRKLYDEGKLTEFTDNSKVHKNWEQMEYDIPKHDKNNNNCCHQE